MSGGDGVWESVIIVSTTLETKSSSSINNSSGILTIFERGGVRRSISVTNHASEGFHPVLITVRVVKGAELPWPCEQSCVITCYGTSLLLLTYTRIHIAFYGS
jgi:hypothetical protein